MKRVVLILVIVALAGCQSMPMFVFNVPEAAPKSPEQIELEKRQMQWIVAGTVFLVVGTGLFTWWTSNEIRKLGEMY